MRVGDVLEKGSWIMFANLPLAGFFRIVELFSFVMIVFVSSQAIGEGIKREGCLFSPGGGVGGSGFRVM